MIEKRQGTKIGCIEEVAFKNGYISTSQMMEIATVLSKSGYGEYLKRVIS